MRQAAPGAFAASIAWYRAGAGAVAHSLSETAPAPQNRVTPPTLVLWGREEPLFPLEWADRIGEFFADATLVELIARWRGSRSAIWRRPSSRRRSLSAGTFGPQSAGPDESGHAKRESWR